MLERLSLLGTIALAAACTTSSAQPAQHPAAQSSAPVVEADEEQPVETVDGRTLWTGPTTCTDGDDLVIADAIIRVDGNGIAASGGCDIAISNSVIEAGGLAIAVSGGGDVNIEGSQIKGGHGAFAVSGGGDINASNCQIVGDILISGGGDVRIAGSTIAGKPRISGNGELHDADDNTWQ